MTSRQGLFSLLASASFAGVTIWMSACSSSSSGGAAPTAGDGTTNAATEAGAQTPEELFRAMQTQLVTTCGGTSGVCHVLGSFENAPKWLGNPDPYISAKNYPGILPASGDPNDSILLTQVEHEGPSLQTYPALFAQAQTWVAAEVAGIKLPETDSFYAPQGTVSVDLSKLGPGLAGAQLTFLATVSGNVLNMTSMKLYAPTVGGLHIDSPYFVIVPSNAPVISDPIENGFSGPLDVPAGASVDFYSGQLILLDWDPSGQLRLVFKDISATTVTVDAGPSGNCTAFSTFESAAVPAFQTSLALPEGGTGTCLNCHGGGDLGATNAMDLSLIGTNDQGACAQARNYINFGNKAMSILLLNPQGEGDPNHPIKSLQPTDPIITGLTTWVTAETN